MRVRMAPPLLITGATGTLGQAFKRACVERGLSHRVTSRAELDIADPLSVAEALGEIEPWAVINTAGHVRVDEAEDDAQRCWRENTLGPTILAGACAQRGIALATFSSDLVFDGKAARLYIESDPVSPLNVYGWTKSEAEREILRLMPQALIVRTSAFFRPWDRYNFATVALRELRAGRPFVAARDQFVSPTYVPHLTAATLDLLIDGEKGIWHLASDGAVSWYEFAARVADLAAVDARSLVAADAPARRAAMPHYSVLGTERGKLLPPLDDALRSFIEARPDGSRQARL